MCFGDKVRILFLIAPQGLDECVEIRIPVWMITFEKSHGAYQRRGSVNVLFMIAGVIFVLIVVLVIAVVLVIFVISVVVIFLMRFQRRDDHGFIVAGG